MTEPRHFINVLDSSAEEIARFLDRSAELKARLKAGVPDRLLLGRMLMAIFEKPSTRTRVSLEAACTTLGGHTLTQEMPAGSRLGDREAIRDVARVVGRYADIVAIRTFGHEVLTEFAAYSPVPVINTLSDYSHPTQALADVLTVREHLGALEGKMLVFIGDGNNVARSLAAAAGRTGMRFRLCCPEGFELDAEFLSHLEAACPGLEFSCTNDPAAAVKDAEVLYTDVWASMGQEGEADERRKVFAPYQINGELLAAAPAGCKVMHCLPAHRGEEITDEAMESDGSVVFDQAENRMHVYRGLFAELLGH